MAIVLPDFAAGELELFDSLKDIKVVVDVGARTDIEYLRLKPDIELHLFEPNREFYQDLVEQTKGNPKVFVNNVAVGDKEGTGSYHTRLQTVQGGENPISSGEYEVPIITLDSYCAKLPAIDFLKIDAEGYDYQVLLGASATIPKCRYIQYEHWNNKIQFHELLEREFYMSYIGGRNVFCQRK